MERPNKIQTFMEMLMKEATSCSFNKLSESWNITEKEADDWGESVIQCFIDSKLYSFGDNYTDIKEWLEENN